MIRQDLPFPVVMGKFEADYYTLGVNEWAESIDNIDIILSDFHDDVAQVLVLNESGREFQPPVGALVGVCANFPSKYGKCTKFWIKVVYEDRKVYYDE